VRSGGEGEKPTTTKYKKRSSKRNWIASTATRILEKTITSVFRGESRSRNLLEGVAALTTVEAILSLVSISWAGTFKAAKIVICKKVCSIYVFTTSIYYIMWNWRIFFVRFFPTSTNKSCLCMAATWKWEGVNSLLPVSAVFNWTILVPKDCVCPPLLNAKSVRSFFY